MSHSEMIDSKSARSQICIFFLSASLTYVQHDCVVQSGPVRWRDRSNQYGKIKTVFLVCGVGVLQCYSVGETGRR